ncbi:hypothetical protein TSUD_149260 [Trifolium subterraneum]|uniref:Formin-like protein n=1 Tax=Trifolium subterraneum TaxID=3900 RepID=A0A2Z6N545_TRISU|nr:hypothetical protein TSUD_149260 [Trifolium subterraneum]
MMHHQAFDQSPRMSSVSDGLKLHGLSSLPLSPALLSSSKTEKGGFSCNSNRQGTFRYAVPVPQRKHWGIPLPAKPIASPPPPPPPLQRRHWEMSATSAIVDQPRSSLMPPELLPPSRPFVLQNQKAMVNTSNQKPKDAAPWSVLPLPNQDGRVLDLKKSQNIAISLKALNVTIEEVCEALLEGSSDTLGADLLESLLKMAPRKEEEHKLKEHKDDSPTKLDLAEKFLKAVLDIPFAFKRVEAMLCMVNFQSEVEYLRKSFQTLEAACDELRNCRMFLKLLEAVLKTGNRMNVGTNRGARLSGTNHITSSTLTEDVKCGRLGLQVVSNLSSELSNVKRAATMDSEALSGDVFKLSK